MIQQLKRFLTDLHYPQCEKRKMLCGYLFFILIAVLCLGIFAAFIAMGYAIVLLRPSHITTIDEFKYTIGYYSVVSLFYFCIDLLFSTIVFLQFSAYGRKTKLVASILLAVVNSFLAWGMWLLPKAIDKISKQIKITDNAILEKAAKLNFTSESYYFWLTLVLVAVSVNLLANAINDKS